MIFNLNTIDQTQHLPECWAKDPSDPEAWCICDELRACEERVHEMVYEAQDACVRIACVKLKAGYAAALDVIWEAVKHLQHSDDCYYREGVLCHCEIKRVIAAIDALRKETND